NGDAAFVFVDLLPSVVVILVILLFVIFPKLLGVDGNDEAAEANSKFCNAGYNTKPIKRHGIMQRTNKPASFLLLVLLNLSSITFIPLKSIRATYYFKTLDTN
ncbi:MAG TPA: hypothetical protein VE130_15595, partial [Nitrososphaeraceae archaeon]|nr:hypothetical protein [Nitrososphaeraceae archaeon]